jgi:hypothetical protein
MKWLLLILVTLAACEGGHSPPGAHLNETCVEDADCGDLVCTFMRRDSGTRMCIPFEQICTRVCTSNADCDGIGFGECGPLECTGQRFCLGRPIEDP